MLSPICSLRISSFLVQKQGLRCVHQVWLEVINVIKKGFLYIRPNVQHHTKQKYCRSCNLEVPKPIYFHNFGLDLNRLSPDLQEDRKFAGSFLWSADRPTWRTGLSCPRIFCLPTGPELITIRLYDLKLNCLHILKSNLCKLMESGLNLILSNLVW